MSNFRLREYVRSFGVSGARWFMIGAIIGSVFLVDYLLKRDVSGKVSDAWNEACIQQVSVMACLDRTEQFHDACFDHAYTSMLLRFGQGRWESFKLGVYEQCMESGDRDPSDPTAGLFEQNPQ